MKFSIKIVVFLLLFSAVNQDVVSQNRIIDEIIWVVGDEAILRSEVEEVRREMMMQNQRVEGDPLCFIPEQMAIQRLFLNQARIDSIEVSDTQVNRFADAQLNDWIASIGSAERLEEYFGRSIPTIREDLRTRIREQELVQGVQRLHFGNIRLTPSDIRNFYTSTPTDSLPFIPTTVEMQIITLAPVIPIEEIDLVRAQLRDFTDRIHSGQATFQSLAIIHSDCPSGAQGGELGFAGRATFHAPFSNVGFALTDPTRVSNIVETEDGFHIIQLIERRGEQANLRHILRRPRVPQASLDTARVHMDSIRVSIIQERITFDNAATFLSSHETRMNRGIMVNDHPSMRQSPNYRTPRFALNEINQDIARVVGNMAVGEISQPFIMRTDRGQMVYAMVKKTNRTEGHRATLTRDYQVIRQLAEEARRQELINEWLRRAIARTYVRINPAWQNCEFQFEGWLR